MAEFPAMPLWTDAYLADTTHLTTLEHGAYLLLLMAMWRTSSKTLPHDDRKLARFSRLTPSQWQRIKPTMMDFFTIEGDQITQGRLTDEANAVRQHSKLQSDRSRARWLKNKNPVDAAAMPGACYPHPLPNKKESAKKHSLVQASPAPYRSRFDEWWLLWPTGTKKARASAKAAFDGHVKHKRATSDEMISALRAQAERWDANCTDPQFIPNPKTWLNQHRWADDLPPIKGNGHARPTGGGAAAQRDRIVERLERAGQGGERFGGAEHAGGPPEGRD